MSNNKIPSDPVVAAADQVLSEYLDDPDIVLFDRSASRKAHFHAVTTLANTRKTPRMCMFAGCAATTIRGSHTIPRSASIAAIAKQGHVITPAFSQTDGKMVARLIGAQHASVFPGFCETHEQLFFAYEKIGYIRSEMDVSRQLFRSVCREVVRLEIEAAHVEQTLREYDEFRRRAIEQLIRQRVSDETVTLSSFETEGPRADFFQSRLEEIQEELTRFQRDFYSAAAAGVDVAAHSGLAVSVVELDRVVPVCLSGRANFYFRTSDGVNHNVRVVVVVIPTPPVTFVAIATPKAHGAMLDAYVASRFANPLTLLAAIECWMLHGTDHWFLSPDAWAVIRPPAQQAILNDILDDTNSIGAFYSRTIFNKLKRELLSNARASPLLSSDTLAEVERNIAPWTDIEEAG